MKQKASTGLYNSSSEVIREGLRLLEERDTIKNMKLEALRKGLNIRLDSLDAGKGQPFDKESIKAKGRVLYTSRDIYELFCIRNVTGEKKPGH